MVHYRRMGNMGGHQQYLENATSTSIPHELRDLWNSPRGTVVRIEALTLVAIALSFFLAAFGSCRRWSNSWFIQKGFVAVNAVFLSLGTYSIGLMQSSPVKSEMYPIWAVSLLALLCCVDSAAASGLDDRSQLWKMLYQLCLYFGYVLLMSISTISSDIGNIAICMLSAVTFIKGFHRSMALVLPSSMRNMVREIPDSNRKFSFRDPNEELNLFVDMRIDEKMIEDVVMTMPNPMLQRVKMVEIVIACMSCKGDSKLEPVLNACKEVCLSFSLSHLLQRRLLGLSSEPAKASSQPLIPNYKRAFKVVEIELAFLYDILYTSNPFLHYYEASSASIWAFASLIGVCFVGAVTLIPGARTTRHASPGNSIVHTTAADFIITGVILVSLALLQVLQLLRCWTSNWARVSFACDCARKIMHTTAILGYHPTIAKNLVMWRSWGMRLRASLIKIDWSDKYQYLWQNKLGQHSLIESISSPGHCCSLFCGSMDSCHFLLLRNKCGFQLNRTIQKCQVVFGLRYIGRVLQETLRCSTGGAVELHADVKEAIDEFVSKKIKSNEVSGWASSKVGNGQSGLPEYKLRQYGYASWFHSSTETAKGSFGSPSPGSSPDSQLKWFTAYCDKAGNLESFLAPIGDNRRDPKDLSNEIYVPCVLMWHIATCYCELAQQCDDQCFLQRTGNDDAKKHHRVATYLSKYCTYLLDSAPGLLPGGSDTTKRAMYNGVRVVAIWSVHKFTDRLRAMKDFDQDEFRQENEVAGIGMSRLSSTFNDAYYAGSSIYAAGVKLGEALHTSMPVAAERWKLLAKFWVKALVYAAPSGKVEEHLQHLSQGGELVTHLWALLYHAGIHDWCLDPPPQQGIKMGWDYIFRIRSWEDLDLNHHQSPESQYRAGDADDNDDITEMMTDDARQLDDGASSSLPPPPPAP